MQTDPVSLKTRRMHRADVSIWQKMVSLRRRMRNHGAHRIRHSLWARYSKSLIERGKRAQHTWRCGCNWSSGSGGGVWSQEFLVRSYQCHTEATRGADKAYISTSSLVIGPSSMLNTDVHLTRSASAISSSPAWKDPVQSVNLRRAWGPTVASLSENCCWNYCCCCRCHSRAATMTASTLNSFHVVLHLLLLLLLLPFHDPPGQSHHNCRCFTPQNPTPFTVSLVPHHHHSLVPNTYPTPIHRSPRVHLTLIHPKFILFSFIVYLGTSDVHSSLGRAWGTRQGSLTKGSFS